MKPPPIRPFQVTRRKLDELFSSPTLVNRMIDARWIVRVREGGRGRESFYDYGSAEAAYKRWCGGEEPESVTSGEAAP